LIQNRGKHYDFAQALRSTLCGARFETGESIASAVVPDTNRSGRFFGFSVDQKRRDRGLRLVRNFLVPGVQLASLLSYKSS